jgi:predicted TPR repeat methyltransferase
MSGGSRQAHDESADQYDDLANRCRWHPEILFGLCFEYLSPDQRLLALGIGTGLCVESFHKYGLRISGVDESPAMLARCAAKAVADDLTEHDLTHVPWPWRAEEFDHVIASGVFHLIEDLAPVLRECARTVRVGGIVAFTIRAPRPDRSEPHIDVEIIDNVPVYAHQPDLLADLVRQVGLDVVKQAQIQVLTTPDDPRTSDTYIVHVTQRRE